MTAPGDGTPENTEGAGENIDPLEGLDFEPSAEAFATDAPAEADEPAAEPTDLEKAQAESADRLADLQRLNAEYVNFSKRAKREQDLARTRGVEDVLAGLLPVLDDITRAKQAGDLTGPFEAIADKLTAVLVRFGVEMYGEVGEEFDPTKHEALMHSTSPDATSTTVQHVVEVGYRIGERVVRAARVAVVGPEA